MSRTPLAIAHHAARTNGLPYAVQAEVLPPAYDDQAWHPEPTGYTAAGQHQEPAAIEFPERWRGRVRISTPAVAIISAAVAGIILIGLYLIPNSRHGLHATTSSVSTTALAQAAAAAPPETVPARLLETEIARRLRAEAEATQCRRQATVDRQDFDDRLAEAQTTIAALCTANRDIARQLRNAKRKPLVCIPPARPQ